jgi:hypothetical protein
VLSVDELAHSIQDVLLAGSDAGAAGCVKFLAVEGGQPPPALWESCVLGGIPKRGGKVGGGTSPQRVISTGLYRGRGKTVKAHEPTQYLANLEVSLDTHH